MLAWLNSEKARGILTGGPVQDQAQWKCLRVQDQTETLVWRPRPTSRIPLWKDLYEGPRYAMTSKMNICSIECQVGLVYCLIWVLTKQTEQFCWAFSVELRHWESFNAAVLAVRLLLLLLLLQYFPQVLLWAKGKKCKECARAEEKWKRPTGTHAAPFGPDWWIRCCEWCLGLSYGNHLWQSN